MRKDAWALVLVLTVGLAPPAAAQPTFGFNEAFPGMYIGDWGGGITSFSNPGTGGVMGAGDGYLFGSRATAGNWGLRCRYCSEYSGDWIAAGITHIGLSLNDVGTDDPFEIHVAIGNDANRWQYNIGFDPPHRAWERFVVDLTDSTRFTQIIGSGTFSEALRDVIVLLIRHDLPPFFQSPDAVAGDLGIDEITLGDLVTPVRPLSWGRLKALYGR